MITRKSRYILKTRSNRTYVDTNLFVLFRCWIRHLNIDRLLWNILYINQYFWRECSSGEPRLNRQKDDFGDIRLVHELLNFKIALMYVKEKKNGSLYVFPVVLRWITLYICKFVKNDVRRRKNLTCIDIVLVSGNFINSLWIFCPRNDFPQWFCKLNVRLTNKTKEKWNITKGKICMRIIAGSLSKRIKINETRVHCRYI